MKARTMAPLIEDLAKRFHGLHPGVAKDFIEFALSPAAREAILAHDFVPYLD